jgi:hypothetical protein
MRRSFFFESIALVTPKEAIYRRLGFRKGTTRIRDNETEEIERGIDDALSLTRLSGVAARLAIEKKKLPEILLSSGRTLDSKSLAGLLRHSEEIMLMGATAGPDIMDEIKKDTSRGRMTRGVILDAAASEMVDHALNWMTAYLNQELRRENRRLTKRRFSAGYGDFPLRNQEWIYGTLGLERLGVRLTGSFMLVPEKSVTAVSGIEKIKA